MEIKNSKLIKITTVLKQKSHSEYQDIKNFWNISNSQNNINFDIINKIENNLLYQIIEKLEILEAQVFYNLFKNEGYATAIEIVSNLKITINKLDEIINSLQKKILIFARKNISNMQLKIHAYGIYDEIYQNLKLQEWINIKEINNNYNILKNKQINNKDISHRLNHILTVNLGQVNNSIKNETSLQTECSKLIENKFLKEKILFFKKFYTVLVPSKNNLKNLKPSENTIENIPESNILFLICICQITYLIKIDKLSITKKNLIKQSDYNHILNKIKDKKILSTAIDFLKETNLILIEENKIIPTKKLLELNTLNYINQYKEILKIKETANIVFNYISNYFHETYFNLKEILKVHFKELLNSNYKLYNPENDELLSEEKLMQEIYFLIYSGLVNSTSKGLILSKLGSEIISNNKVSYNYRDNSIIVTSDLTILIYSDNIENNILQLISLFSEIESEYYNTKTILFKITKESIIKGVILGHSYEKFIECLEKSSSSKIPDNILYNIKSWGESVKKVTMKKVQIIEGDSKIIKQLKYNKDISSKTKDYQSNSLILISENNIPTYIESGNNVIIVNKDE